MPGEKEHQEICVVGRLFSLEALLFVMGVVSLVYGLWTLSLINIGIGVAILLGTFVLFRVCRAKTKQQPIRR